MKKDIAFYVCIVLLISACTKERTTYEISGTLDGVEDGFVVELVSNETYETIDTCIVVNGEFKLNGSVDRPTDAFLDVLTKVFFILENSQYKLHQTGEYSFYLRGGDLNTQVNGYKWNEEYLELSEEKMNALNEGPELGDLEGFEAQEAQIEFFTKATRPTTEYVIKFQDEILKGDYPALVKLFTLVQCYDVDKYNLDKKLELLEEYKKELGDHPYLAQSQKKWLNDKKFEDLRKQVEPGKPYKEVTALTREGVTLNLSDVITKNEYTLLEIWASWCGPCRAEFPHLKEAYAQYRKNGFEIYALSIDEAVKKWFKAMEQENVPWINVKVDGGFDAQSMLDYGVQGIPSSFLISRDGIIVASGMDIRGYGLDKKLEELFRE